MGNKVSSKLTAVGLGGAFVVGVIAGADTLDIDLSWLDNPVVASGSTLLAGWVLGWLKLENRPSPSARETIDRELFGVPPDR